MSSGYEGRRLRVAVVGTGMIAGVHARAARASGAEVLGVLGRNAARSEQVAAQLDQIGRAHV